MTMQDFQIDPGGNIIVKVIADDTDLTTGDGKARFTIPAILGGYNLVVVGAHIYTAASSGVTTIQLHNETDGQDILTDRITIDATELDSKDANVPPAINGDYDDIIEGDVIRIDVDTVGTGVKGLEVRMGFR